MRINNNQYFPSKIYGKVQIVATLLLGTLFFHDGIFL
jgi:hypothetical protein